MHYLRIRNIKGYLYLNKESCNLQLIAIVHKNSDSDMLICFLEFPSSVKLRTSAISPR